MSRSFRHNYILKFGSKGAKRSAARKVRRYKDTIPNGSWYKKLYPQYDVCDAWCYEPKAMDKYHRFIYLGKELILNIEKYTHSEAQSMLEEMKELNDSYKYIWK